MLMVGGECFITVTAVSEFDTQPISESDKHAILDSMRLQLVSNDTYSKGIKCFDVSENGTIALGVGTGRDCRIYAYNENGEFLYGYKFSANSDYGIEFWGETIVIFFIRGDVLVAVNSSGECVDMAKIVPSEKNYLYAKQILNRTSKTVSGKVYQLERTHNWGDTYSSLCVTDEAGNTEVVFSSEGNETTLVIMLLFPIAFFGIIIFGLIRKRGIKSD